MRWTIFVILLVLWLLGLVSSYTLGGFIHILLVIAIVMLIINLIRGPPPLYDLRVATSTPGLQRYQQAARDFPFEVADLLVMTRGRLLGNSWWNRLAIPLLVSPQLSAPPWEALIVLALPAAPKSRMSRFWDVAGRTIFLAIGGLVLLLGVFRLVTASPSYGVVSGVVEIGVGLAIILLILTSRRVRGNELHFYRGGTRRWNNPQRAEAWKTKRVECDCSRKWRLFAEQGLAPLRKKRFWVSELHRSTPTGPRSLLYAVGRAVSSTAGLQLEIANEEELSKQISESVAGGRTLLGSEELRRREAVLTIIQGEPLTERSTRGQSDRESAALLRALAAELFAAGAEAVLVLPSLHAPMAEAALRIIARTLASSRTPTLHRMLDAVACARKKIRDWPEPPQAVAGKTRDARELEWFRHDQIESALDICLFARDDLSLPLSETTPKA
jgi:hypothetical protein